MVDLLKSFTTPSANLEFTSFCNLKCVYCASLYADYQGQNINPKSLKNIFSSLREKTEKKRLTRDCLDPWNFAFIRADSSVAYCCTTKSRLGFLNNGLNLDKILNESKALKCREELLNGNLNEKCLTCPQKGWTNVDEFKKKVLDFVLSEHERRFKIYWEKGFYHLESKIEDGKIKYWRWCETKGQLSIKNDFPEALKLKFECDFFSGEENFSPLIVESKKFREQL